jgi:hypothetical protein
LGGRPARDEPPATPADILPLYSDSWDLEILRHGLDDARGTGQDVLPSTSTEPGGYEDDLYVGGGGLPSIKNTILPCRRACAKITGGLVQAYFSTIFAPTLKSIKIYSSKLLYMT